MLQTITKLFVRADADPITDIFNKDWAAVGGWTIAIIVIFLVIVAFLTGRIVPGWMYKEIAATLAEAMKQNSTLLAAADIAKHFFQVTTPARPVREKRSEVKHGTAEKAEPPGGKPKNT